MNDTQPFVDIHCHLLPGIDDGAKSWEESLEMAQIAVADGISTIIATPHQLGNFLHNEGASIRERTRELQLALEKNQIPLRILAGADVRIDTQMIGGLRSGKVVTLADQRRHVLLELPHELYFPLEPVLQGLHAAGMTGVLSHPERNQGLLKHRQLLAPLVDKGCLMQVTAGSLLGTFGPASQEFSEWMLAEGLVHFVATDAHGCKSRRPLIRRAFERVMELAGDEAAHRVCCDHPTAVVEGKSIPSGRLKTKKASGAWFRWRKAG